MAQTEALRISKEVRRDLTPYLPTHNPLPTSSHYGPVENPHVTITYAASLDSMIAIAPNRQTVISGPQSKAMTHYLRFVHDAIVIGVNTAITDDPTLNSRTRDATKMGVDSQPRPVVLDTTGKWDAHKRCKMVAAALNGTGKPPWVFVHKSHLERVPRARRDLIEDCGGAYIGFEDRDSLIAALGSRGIRSVMIEGGAKVINHFLDNHLARISSIIITLAPVFFGRDGVKVLPKNNGESAAVSFDDVKWIPLGRDMIMCGFPIRDEKSMLPPVQLSDSLPNGHSQEISEPEQPTPVPPKRKKAEETCFACGEPGHIKRDCPLAQRNAMKAAPPDTQTRVEPDESVASTPAPDDVKNEILPQESAAIEITEQNPVPTLQPPWNERAGYSTDHAAPNATPKNPSTDERFPQAEKPAVSSLRTSRQPISWADDTPVSEHPPPTPPWMKKQTHQSLEPENVSSQTVEPMPEDYPDDVLSLAERAPSHTNTSQSSAKQHKHTPQENDASLNGNLSGSFNNVQAGSEPTADGQVSRRSKQAAAEPRSEDAFASTPSKHASSLGDSQNHPDEDQGAYPELSWPNTVFSLKPSKYADDPAPSPSRSSTSQGRSSKAVLRHGRASPPLTQHDENYNANSNDARNYGGRGRPDRSRGGRGRGRGRYNWESDAPPPMYADTEPPRYNNRGRGNPRFDEERPRRGKFAPRGNGRHQSHEEQRDHFEQQGTPYRQQDTRGNAQSWGGDQQAEDSWANNQNEQSKPSWDKPVDNAWGTPASDVW